MKCTRKIIYFECVRNFRRTESDPRDIFFHLVYLSYGTTNFAFGLVLYTERRGCGVLQIRYTSTKRPGVMSEKTVNLLFLQYGSLKIILLYEVQIVEIVRNISPS
jgi:hypothetical protein